jgi:hypothetical protein
LLLPLLVGCGLAAPVQAEEPNQAASLAREVQLLNLLNGLDLSNEQMAQLLEQARQARDVRARFQERAEERRREMEEILTEFRDLLQAGQKIPEELETRYHAAHRENERLLHSHEAEIAVLARQTEAILEEHQRHALEAYVPCIVPPKGELRVGQVPDVGGALETLERIRALPEDRFVAGQREIGRRILRRILERAGRGRVVVVDDEAELARILELLGRVRELTPIELEAHGPVLLEELLAPYEKTASPEHLTDKVRQHLLSPEIIPLIEARLAGE